MLVLQLLTEDGHKISFMPFDTIRQLATAIDFNAVDTIVVGELDAGTGKVAWEKQFSAVTVMPSEFGARREGQNG